ncbi:MAG: hypothetical protein CR982_10795 [Candidatus Cloacimonadota bacterium]|nr:MAG: hypothetical protein CR982_10795 [Candidatus Cloacimonadota bacterium]PIE78962.1 MAG: hypothetical protein CSA15_05120 [Candidatus Delongbacteria bacterium]
MGRREKIIAEAKSMVVIILGLIVHTFGWTAFLIPAKVTGGGVSGASTLIFYATGIPVGASYLVFNTILILIGIKSLGRGFGLKTIVSVPIAALFLWIGQQVITEPIIDDTFLSVVLGGAFAGSGMGILFTRGSSTGGTDIIAMMINKYKNISPGKVILYFDILIIGSSYFVFKKLEPMVYSMVCIGVISYSIDLVLNGVKQSTQLFIVSKKYKEIADKVTLDIHRGVTIMDAEGWYSRKPTKIIMTIVKKQEANKINKIVKSIDPTAFISQGAVTGAYGKGFDEIKG